MSYSGEAEQVVRISLNGAEVAAMSRRREPISPVSAPNCVPTLLTWVPSANP